MFWSKTKAVESTSESIAEQVAGEAEALYRSGKMHCAEAVLAAVQSNFRPDSPAEMVRLAAGFGGGSGVGCICGAVSGGTMALGLVLEDDPRRVKKLTQDLHRWFKEEYGPTCCKVILQTHGKVCPTLTGRVAGKVAAMLTLFGEAERTS
jgi:C_GCAxxG_C_C family probable redox protein